VGKTADDAVEVAVLVIGELKSHGNRLAEEVFMSDRLAGLADEVELVRGQGAEVFFSGHGVQQQYIFAEEGGGSNREAGLLAAGHGLLLGEGKGRGTD